MNPKKYQIVVPHQDEVENDRLRRALRDTNEQFKQIAADVSQLSNQVMTLSSTTAPSPSTLIQVLPSAQPIAQPAGGTTGGAGAHALNQFLLMGA